MFIIVVLFCSLVIVKMSDDDGPPRKKQRQARRQSVVKLAKVKGDEHVNHVGKHIPQRTIGPDCRLVVVTY